MCEHVRRTHKNFIKKASLLTHKFLFFIVMKVNFMHALLMLPGDCILSIMMTFIDRCHLEHTRSNLKYLNFHLLMFYFFIHHHHCKAWRWILINQTWENRAVGFVEVTTYNYYAPLHHYPPHVLSTCLFNYKSRYIYWKIVTYLFRAHINICFVFAAIIVVMVDSQEYI